MNNPNEVPEWEDTLELTVRPRDAETVSIQMPKDTLASLKKVAEQRDMALDALLKLYIGKCLRQDLSQLFANQVLDSTAKDWQGITIQRLKSPKFCKKFVWNRSEGSQPPTLSAQPAAKAFARERALPSPHMDRAGANGESGVWMAQNDG